MGTDLKKDLFANSSSHESKCKGIYFLEFIFGPKDWETGYVEDWKWVIKKVNE